MKQLKLMFFIVLLAMVGCKNADRDLALLRGHEWLKAH